MKAAMFCFITGLIVTLGGVGGIEHSETNSQLIDSIIVSLVGLITMAVATQLFRKA